jgi:6-phosphofructo-2-kinase
VQRLSPFIIEAERQRRPVLVVGHLSSLQVLLAYFRGVPVDDCPRISVPMHAVVELMPHQYGWIERLVTFDEVMEPAGKAEAEAEAEPEPGADGGDAAASGGGMPAAAEGSAL